LVFAGNLLDRQFMAEGPNRKWVADLTYLCTAEGWLYVAMVLDLLSRRGVGWSMSETMTTQLAPDALMMAIWRRADQMPCCITPTRAANRQARAFNAFWQTTGCSVR
jgi:transposase InsO family protein